MATCLALVMLAVAFAYVAEPQETDAVDVGDTTVIGSLEYLVVDASKRYTDSSLGSHTRIFVMGVNGNTAIAANAFSGWTAEQQLAVEISGQEAAVWWNDSA